MFDIGWGELVVIGVIALIVIGPKELPTVLRTVGRWMGKVRRMASEFQGQFQDALREAELHDLKKQADELTSSVNESVSEMSRFDPVADTQKEIESALPPEPALAAPEPAALAPPAPPPDAALPEPAAEAASPEPSAAVAYEAVPKSAGSGA
jgi:sec-independent protein translocase protein TatB